MTSALFDYYIPKAGEVSDARACFSGLVFDGASSFGSMRVA